MSMARMPLATAWAGFDIGGFVWVNAVLLRTLHQTADIPFRIDALLGSDLVQASLSLFRTLLALVAMVFGHSTRLVRGLDGRRRPDVHGGAETTAGGPVQCRHHRAHCCVRRGWFADAGGRLFCPRSAKSLNTKDKP